MRQLADVDPVADLPCHGVVFFLYLQRAQRVVVVNVLAFVDEGYSGMRVLLVSLVAKLPVYQQRFGWRPRR